MHFNLRWKPTTRVDYFLYFLYNDQLIKYYDKNRTPGAPNPPAEADLRLILIYLYIYYKVTKSGYFILKNIKFN